MDTQIVVPTGLKPRKILPRIIESLLIEEILVLSGARQVGKTYLLYLLWDFLTKKGTSPSQMFFFNLEDPSLLQFLDKSTTKEFIEELRRNGADTSKKTYVFVDEIQYLKHPSSFLKQIFDLHPQIKLIVSGSSSMEMKKKFTDRLTGRKRFFEILPLSLSEIVDFKNLKRIDWPQILSDYALYGGYPRVILRESLLEKKNTLLSIYDDYVRKDIRDLAKIPELSGFNNLVGIAAAQIGNLVSDTEISSKTGLNRNTVKKYLNLLEGTFVLSLLKPYSNNPRTEFVRMPKMFFSDTGLRNAISGGFSDLTYRSDIGAVMENVVFEEISKSLPPFWSINFWRTKQGQEVDFIVKSDEGKIIPVEVKYQNIQKPELTRSFLSFLTKYQPEMGFVLTKNFEGMTVFNKTRVKFLPVFKTDEIPLK